MDDYSSHIDNQILTKRSKDQCFSRTTTTGEFQSYFHELDKDYFKSRKLVFDTQSEGSKLAYIFDRWTA